MALFGSRKKTSASPRSKRAPAPSSSGEGWVLIRPRMTEKAAHLSAAHVYTFEVSPRATKRDVAKAVQALYRVKPKKVAIVKTPGKRVSLRTRRGMGTRSGMVKAYVFLKSGDRIDFAS